jgi:hypothetical protein
MRADFEKSLFLQGLLTFDDSGKSGPKCLFELKGRSSTN